MCKKGKLETMKKLPPVKISSQIAEDYSGYYGLLSLILLVLFMGNLCCVFALVLQPWIFITLIGVTLDCTAFSQSQSSKFFSSCCIDKEICVNKGYCCDVPPKNIRTEMCGNLIN